MSLNQRNKRNKIKSMREFYKDKKILEFAQETSVELVDMSNKDK